MNRRGFYLMEFMVLIAALFVVIGALAPVTSRLVRHQRAPGQPHRHQRAPVRRRQHHLRPRAAIAQPAGNERLPDPVVGHTAEGRHLGQPARGP